MSRNCCREYVGRMKVIYAGAGRRRNRRSGRNQVAASVPVESGEDEIACAVAPGDVQIDSVWLCGGDASGTFAQLATAAWRVRLEGGALRPHFSGVSGDYPLFSRGTPSKPLPKLQENNLRNLLRLNV